MELWATGFNAWGNVSFDEDDSGRKDWQDLPNFTRVLRDESIEVKAVYTSATLGKPFDQFALTAAPTWNWKVSRSGHVFVA
jgi:hypothetical protein